jgi:hypothetical protein
MKRDRLTLEWTGDFYLEAPVDGKVYGAVFLGRGKLSDEPTAPFERDSVVRFLKADRVAVDFGAAVLRFSDDTGDLLAKLPSSVAAAPAEAQKLANELEERHERDTGLNLCARLLSATENGDTPGIFFAEFSGGGRGRFAALIDHQMQSLAFGFGLNGGEKGVIYQHAGPYTASDIWTAFYDEQDIRDQRVAYASSTSLVGIPDYRMKIDLREAPRWVKAEFEMDLVARRDGVMVVPFELNEGFIEPNEREKKGMRIEGATLGDGSKLEVIQEAAESAVSVVLPRALHKDEKVTVRLEAQGEHMFQTWNGDFHYPYSTETWFPRHEYLGRSRYEVTFLHKNKTVVACVGHRTKEQPYGDNGKDRLTEWVSDDPISLVSFAVGPFERHDDKVKANGREIPVEFYSIPGNYGAVKEDYIVAELGNGVNFFSFLFGDYPYGRLGAVFFPSNFGQGFPTLLLLPTDGQSGLWHYSFVAHEISHQWWGDLVTWRSYRDQWLSEGFADYSAALYASRRDNPKRALDLVREMRRRIEAPPTTDTGVGSGKLYEVGPLIMGLRLSSRRTNGAYTGLVYAKGALTLRMIHFLFSNPTDGNDEAFYKMMKDFVDQNRGQSATTESFFRIASEKFAETPIGKKYGITDLGWFLRQWVYETGMPTYRLEYGFEPRPGGGVFLTGTIYQDGVGDNWMMPLPIRLEFGGGKGARGTILARGPQSAVKIALPAEPTRVDLDPDMWILTNKTSETRVKH